MSAVQFCKGLKGNDIWALVMLSQEPEQPQQPSDNTDRMEQLLLQYQDVFEDPKTLPPNRVYDHAIPLLPNAVPVNARPYRYSPAHKDEI